MKNSRKARRYHYRRRERREIKRALGKIKNKTAAPKDYSDAKHDYFNIYRCEWW